MIDDRHPLVEVLESTHPGRICNRWRLKIARLSVWISDIASLDYEIVSLDYELASLDYEMARLRVWIAR